jgi:hypothetical protein
VGLPCLPASVRVESSCWAGESSLGPSTTRTGRRRSRACSSTGTCAASTSGSPGTPGHRGPFFAPQARQARSDPTRSRARASAVAQSRATVPVVLPRCVPIPVPQAADRLGSRTTRRSTRQPPASSTRRSSPGADHHAGPQPREHGLAEDFVHTSSGTTSAGPSSAPPNPCSCSSSAGSRTTTPRRHHGALGLRRPAEYRATLHSVPPSV